MVELFSSTEDRIKVLFYTATLVRSMPDELILWKLDKSYLDLLCEYMHIISHDNLLTGKFLDAGIDTTTKDCGCVGLKNFYPLMKI